MSIRLLSVISTVWVVFAAWAPQPAGAQQPIRFRRIYAPADRMRDWPRDDVKYMPVESAEFERLVKMGSGGSPGFRPPVTARSSSAQYQARLVDKGLLAGKATLEVVHSGTAPSLLLLDPCGVAITEASWAGDERPPDEPARAVLGLAPDDKLAVLVHQSGRLQFNWSLAGREDATGAVEFQLQLPPCSVNHLLLDVPENLTPLIDRGVVARAGQADDRPGQWQVELGGHHRFLLRLVPAEQAGRRGRLPVVNESVQYHFSLRGLEVLAELKFEPRNEPLREVVLKLDPQLELVGVEYGGRALPWSITAPEGQAQTRAVVTFPEAAANFAGAIKLRALAPLALDRRWQLPRIRIEGMFWQEGHATLFVPAPLLIQQLRAINCRQSATGPLSPPRTGETAEFQFFAPNSTVEVVLARRRAPVQVASGTAIELGSGEMTARVGATFEVAEGATYLLEADVARQWTIDSVESSALDEWTLGKAARGQRTLSVHLAKGVIPGGPVRLSIVAHRLHSLLEESMGIDDLVPLRFRAAPDGEHLMAVDTVERFHLRLTAAERLERQNPRSLGAAQRELFAELPRNLLFRRDEGAEELRIALESRKPNYRAVLRVEAIVQRDMLRENYVLQCEPGTARVRRVLVQLSSPDEAPLRWTLGTEDDRQISARRLSIEERAAAGYDPQVETWELMLRRPRSETFRIHGTRSVPLTDRHAISLASLPEASHQQATLVVRSASPKTVRVEAHRLVPIPVETVPPDRLQTTLAAYRYDPGSDTAAPGEGRASILVSSDAATPAVWVWDLQLESRYEADGTGRHVAIYRLQNSRAGRLKLKLPAEADSQISAKVWLNDDRVAWPRAERSLTLELRPLEKFPTLLVHFTTPKARLGIAGSLRPPFPTIDVPVLWQHWTVWLPPGYDAYGSEPCRRAAREPGLSWSQRLFGPVGRERGGEIFDPLSPQAWLRTVFNHQVRREAAKQTESLLETLGLLAEERAGRREEGGLDWAGLLTDPAIEALPLTLLVDRYALARMGLVPQSLLRRASAATSLSCGVGLLENANLALLVRSDVVLLTGQTDAALLHAHLEPLEHRSTWRVLPGPLAEQMQLAAAGRSQPDIVTVHTWRREPAEAKALWTHPSEASYKPADTCGWSAHRLTTSDTLPATLRYVHSRTIRLFGSLAFLLLAALGYWKACDRPLLLTGLIGVPGIAALVLSEAYVPIASGALLGILFCLALCLLRRRGRPGQSSPGAGWNFKVFRRGSALANMLLMVFAAAAVVLLCARARGQDADAESPAATAPVHRVFIPIDDDQQPSGDRVYVPQALYNQLYRRAAETTQQPEGWLISAAAYRGALSREATSGRLVVDELKAIFDVRVLGLTARIRVPFDRQEANLVPDGALLDGLPIEPEWEPAERALLFDVSQQGRHRLELALRPALRNGNAPGGFDLTIPRLATSRLELALPSATTDVEVPSAAGAVRFEDQPPRVIAELGPGNRLSVRWPQDRGSVAAGNTVDVDEFLWLKIQPGSVVLDARFRVKVLGKQVRRLQLVADPQLQLLPLQGDDPPKVETRTSPGQAQTIELQWPRPLGEAVTVGVTFLLRGASGVGNLRLPELSLRGARPARRWLAVSVDPALAHDEPPPDRPDALAVPDFLREWGSSEAQPQLAYRLTAGQSDWSMSIQPHESTTTIEQTLALSFDRESAAVRFGAQLVTTSGYNFQYRLQVPPDLLLDEVSLTEDGVERTTRWTQDKRGVLTVFLTGPAEGWQELSLSGRLPVLMNGAMTSLPWLGFDPQHGKLESSVVEVYRRPAVLVRFDGDEKDREIDAHADSPVDPELGRLVGRLQLEPGKPGRTRLAIVPNQPNVDVQQITRVQCDAETWRAEVECDIEVSGGVMDQIRLHASSPFNGPYRIKADPPATITVAGPADGRRQLIVQPRRAISGSYRFTISSPITLSPGERPHAPQVTLVDVDHVTRQLVLPARVQGEPIGWEVEGLRETSREAGLITYEVIEPTYQARSQPPEPADETARVQLADIRIAWNTDETCRGVATFDLQPGDLSEVVLELPSGYHPVQVVVAGVCVAPAPTPSGAWRIPLGPRRLPQRLEVVFDGTLPQSADGRRFDAPHLAELPVDRSLWTVAGPSPYTAARPKQPGTITSWEQQLFRLKSTHALIESASMIPSEDADETFRWYWPWVRRLMVTQRALLAELPQISSGDRARAVRAEMRSIEQRQLQLASRLGMSNAYAQASAGQSVADEPAGLFDLSLDPTRPVTRCAFSQAADSISLSYRRAEPWRWLHHLLAAGLLLAAVGLLALGIHRRLLREWFKRWPHAIGVGVGLAWWLWLWPSVLGWLIVLICLISAFLSGWRHPRRAPGSSVLSIRSVER